MGTIGDRVREAIHGAGLTQKEVAERVEMTPDALSRALNGQRGFAALELADIARELDADLDYLITGEPDPYRFVVSARHAYDHETHERSVDGEEQDRLELDKIALVYAQAGPYEGTPPLPSEAVRMREDLGPGFAIDFIHRLEGIGVDVVRVEEISTSYSLTIGGRSVIVIDSTGNWFRENWSIAHELGHLALGHRDVMPGRAENGRCEAEANAFAADLLLPEPQVRALDWRHLDLADLADFIWEWGVSTDALSRRLNKLGLSTSETVAQALENNTQRLLRHHWEGADQPGADAITDRMTRASQRYFPVWLRNAHLDRIAVGAQTKGSLAWMLGVDADTLDVEMPQDDLATDDLLELVSTNRP